MNYSLSAWGHLEKLVWRDVLIVAAVLFLARLVILVGTIRTDMFHRK